MLMQVFAVYDSKVQAFSIPFILKSKGEALRSFTEISNDKSSSIGKYPSDFTLFNIAQYEDTTGLITSYDTPVSLGLALEFVHVVE